MCCVLLVLFSSIAAAEPDKIDVVGLTPGESSLEQYKWAGTSLGNNAVWLEIGGYKLPCKGEFNSGILEMLSCMTGGNGTEASNIEIYDVLLKGFSGKFGAPTSTYTTPVRTRIGVEYQANEVWWIDKQGNGLILYSMQGKIDRGGLLLLSSTQLQKMKQDVEQKEKARKF